MKKAISFCCMVFTLALQLHGQVKTPKLLILGIDGVRPDALQLASTPNLDTLMENGIYSYDAFTDFPTTTFPGFASMLTGVYNGKHKIYDGSVAGSQLQRYPYFLKRLEETDSSLYTSIFITPPFGTFLNQVQGLVDTIFYNSQDLIIKLASEYHLTNDDPDIMFTYFVGPDKAGHTYGFSPNVPNYISAIEIIDDYIGEILVALKNRPTYSTEDWVILVSTDHGGIGLNHGGPTILDRKIFFIASGDSVSNNKIEGSNVTLQVDSSIEFNGIDQYVAIPYQPAYDFNANNDFSVECWIQPKDSGNLSIAISNQDLSDPDSKGFTIAYNVNNAKNWVVNLGDGNRSNPFFGNTLHTDSLQHIAFTVNRDELITLYQNGVNINADIVGYIDDLTTDREITIAQDGVKSFSSNFKGIVKEVRIWDVVLSENAVAEYACKELNDQHPHYKQLIGYWKLDAVAQDTVKDNSPFKNHGFASDTSLKATEVNLNIECIDYSQTPRIVDVAHCALDQFCVPIRPRWEMQGRSWLNKNCGLDTCQKIIGLNTTNIIENSATYSWTLASGSFIYIIRGKELYGKAYTYALLPPGTSQLNVFDLKPGTKYEWQISAACNQAATSFSEWSENYVFSTLPFECPYPDSLFEEAVTSNFARLRWNIQQGAAGYKISGRPSNSGIAFIELTVPGGNTESLDVANLATGTTYEWFVQSLCPFDITSDPSQLRSFSTTTGPSSKSGNEINQFVAAPAPLRLQVSQLNSKLRVSIVGVYEGLDAIRICDLSGRVLGTYELNGSDHMMLPIVGLAPGVYIIQSIGMTSATARFYVN